MNEPTDIQIIMQNGRPAFVVIPYDEYRRTFHGKKIPEGDGIPHEVVGMTVKKGYSLIRAWREYLGLTQQEVAERMRITQAALSQMESGGKRLRKETQQKLAAALGVQVTQIQE